MRILLLHHVDNPNLYAGSVWIIGPAVGGWLATNYGYTNSFVIAGVGAALCSLGYTQLPETLVSKLEKVEKEKEKPDRPPHGAATRNLKLFKLVYIYIYIYTYMYVF